MKEIVIFLFFTLISCAFGLQFISVGDNEHWIWADGVQLGHSSSAYGNLALNVTVPDDTEILAVQTFDWDYGGGLIGSLSNGIVTDSSWRCARSAEADFIKKNFDDSHWAAANATRSPGAQGAWDYFPTIAAGAKWIWNGPYGPDRRVTVLCRRRLKPLIFTSTGDNEHWIYADGVEIGHFSSFSTAYNVTVPIGTRAIAVKLADWDQGGGLIGSFTNGVVTDSSWKCSRQLQTNWEKADFDDSKWAAAVDTRSQGAPGVWDNVSAVAANAKWIAAESYYGDKITHYCRRKI